MYTLEDKYGTYVCLVYRISIVLQMAGGKVVTEFIRFGHVKIPTTVSFYRTSLSFAFVNKSPILPGHVLVSPVRAVERFSGLTPDEVSDLFITVQRVSGVMEKLHDVTALTISIQDGEEAGQSVKHVHVHILPRKKGDFENNDDIYTELATHDKVKERKDRSLQEMEEETIIIRNLIESNNKYKIK